MARSGGFYRFSQIFNKVLKRHYQRSIIGGCYALDNQYDPDSAVAVRFGYFIYHGRADPYSARNSHNSGVDTLHSRAEGPVGD